MKEFEILRSVAERDLRDSKLLFKKKRFQNAIFLLQQADEKAAKAVLLHMGFVLTSSDVLRIQKGLRSHPTQHTNLLLQMLESFQSIARENEWSILSQKYGHEWLNSFLRILTKIAEPIDKIAAGANMMPLLKKGLDENNPAVKSTKWETGNFKEKVLKAVENFKNLKKFRNPTVKMLEDEMKACKIILESPRSGGISPEEGRLLAKSLLGDAWEKRETTEEMENPMGDMFGDVMRLLVLGVLAIYLCPHYTLARYQDERVDFEYDSNFALVKKNKEIIELIERCL